METYYVDNGLKVRLYILIGVIDFYLLRWEYLVGPNKMQEKRRVRRNEMKYRLLGPFVIKIYFLALDLPFEYRYYLSMLGLNWMEPSEMKENREFNASILGLG